MPFHGRDKRWACLVAHRRAGKTVCAVNELIRGALTCTKPRPQFRYIAPFYSQAKAVAWEYLKYFAGPVMTRSNESELWVEVLGGGRIRLYGADNADAMRGGYSDGDYLDEYGDFKPSVWGNVIRPALSDRQGWAVFGGTPKGKNQFWEVAEIARKNPADWFLLKLPASESGLLPKPELLDAQRQLSQDQYEQEYECSFEAAILGAYFGKELRLADQQGRVCDVPHDPNLKVFTAWDLGFKDDTAIWWYQAVRGEIHLIDYYAVSGADIEQIAKVVRSKPYDYERHYLPHDARAKTLAARGKSIVEQLVEHLGHTLAVVPDIGVQDGIQAVRKVLPRCYFDQTSCGEGLEALRQYQREYDEDKKAFRDKPRHDWTSHPSDAFRMMAVAYQQEERPLPEPKGKTLDTITIDELWEHHETHREEARI